MMFFKAMNCDKVVFKIRFPNYCLSNIFFTGIKEFSDWPTIPQVYINGEFVGGCDILLQMHQSGDLIEELKKIGIESLLLKEAKNPEKSSPKDTNLDKK